MSSNANAAQLKRISDALESGGWTSHPRGRGARAEQVPLPSHPSQLIPHRSVGEAAYSSNGYAVAGHGGYAEPVAENFPLRGSAKGGDRNLPDMAFSPVGPHSVRDRGRDKMALAAVGSIVWGCLSWAAQNKLDTFGWAGFFALVVDPWVQWTAKVGKMMGYVFY